MRSALDLLPAAPPASAPRILSRLFARAAARRHIAQLAEMPDYLLDDVGLTRDDVRSRRVRDLVLRGR